MIQEVVQQVEKIAKDVMNNGIHTAMPGEIVAIDPETGLLDVKPIGSFYCENIEMPYPIIPEVPICIPANAEGAAICVPMSEGDKVLLIFTEQSLSALLTDTEEGHANEKFELQNCIAIPGVQAAPNELQAAANESKCIIIANEGSEIEIGADGVFVSAPSVTIEGDLNVTGRIHADGDIGTSGHLHSVNGTCSNNS